MLRRCLPVVLLGSLALFACSFAQARGSSADRSAKFDELHGERAAAEASERDTPGSASSTDETVSCRVTDRAAYELRLYEPESVEGNATFQGHSAILTALLNAGPGN